MSYLFLYPQGSINTAVSKGSPPYRTNFLVLALVSTPTHVISSFAMSQSLFIDVFHSKSLGSNVSVPILSNSLVTSIFASKMLHTPSNSYCHFFYTLYSSYLYLLRLISILVVISSTPYTVPISISSSCP